MDAFPDTESRSARRAAARLARDAFPSIGVHAALDRARFELRMGDAAGAGHA